MQNVLSNLLYLIVQSHGQYTATVRGKILAGENIGE